MTYPYPHTLTSLTPREAITDALHRAIIAIDRNDISLLKTAVTDDITLELRGQANPHIPTIISGLSEYRTHVMDTVGPLDTTHMVSNVRIDVKEGAETASLTCYVLAQHFPVGRGKEADGGPNWFVGGENRIDVVRDGSGDGGWRIKKWVVDPIWKQGDVSVMQVSK